MIRGWRNYLSERAILMIGWLWFVVYAYPGYMSFDSATQLAQARHLELINEWQPPVMAELWRITDHVIAGPFPMLVIQSSAFLIGLHLTLRRVISPRRAAFVAVAMLLLPPNIIVLAVIWKDAQMAGFLMLGIGALLSQQRGWRIVGYACLFLATGVRYNAAAATFPIVMFQFGFAHLPRWRRRGLAVAAWVALTIGAFALNVVLTERHLYPWATAAAPVDINGILRFSPHLDNDQLLRDTPGVPWHKTDKIQIRARTWYRPDLTILALTQEPGQVFDYATTDEQRAGIAAAWKTLVLAHPWAFFRHRVAVFHAQLVEEGGPFFKFTYDIYKDWLEHRAVHSIVQWRWITKLMWLGSHTAIYHVAFYFVLLLVLLPFCVRDRLAAMFLLSGLAHEAGLFAVAPAIDYRYSQWMIACALVGAVLIFVRRLRSAEHVLEQ